MNRTFCFALVAVALLMLAGCHTMQGAGKDIQKAGEAIERAAKRNK